MEELMEIIGFKQEEQFFESDIDVFEGDYLKFFVPCNYRLNIKTIEKLKNMKVKGKPTLYILNTLRGGEFLYKELSEKYNLIYEDWCTWWAYGSVNQIALFRELYEPTNPTKTFVSLNHNPRISRCKFIDKLSETGLIDNNYVSWQGYNTDFEFKHFDNRKLLLDNDFYSGDPHKYPFNNFKPPKKAFKDSLWAVVCTTMNNHDFNLNACFTDSSWIPILHKKPFLTLGAKEVYKDFIDLGFEFYDEVVDYSYIRIDDYDERLDAFIEQVQKISTLDKTKTHELLKPKIERNYNRILNIAKNKIISVGGKTASEEHLKDMRTLLKSFFPKCVL